MNAKQRLPHPTQSHPQRPFSKFTKTELAQQSYAQNHQNNENNTRPTKNPPSNAAKTIPLHNQFNNYTHKNNEKNHIPSFQKKWGARPFGPNRHLHVLGSTIISYNRNIPTQACTSQNHQNPEPRSEMGPHWWLKMGSDLSDE